MTNSPWRVCTGNPGKLSEYRLYLGAVEPIVCDLKEPAADIETIVRYKASQCEGALIDDVALDVEGLDIGVNIRWHLDEVGSWIGRSAIFVCVVGRLKDGRVELYRGEKRGLIVEPRGSSFGFNRYFLPEGAAKTYGEEITREMNPRFMALSALLKAKPWKTLEPLHEWTGEFQG